MDEHPQRRGSEKMLDCQRRKAGPAGTFREVLAETTLGGPAERLPRPLPDQGIKIARKEAELGYAVWTRNYIDDMRNFGVVGGEVREKTLSLLDEVPPESYESPCDLEEPPGSTFIFHC